jgi:hypothetical protein
MGLKTRTCLGYRLGTFYASGEETTDLVWILILHELGFIKIYIFTNDIDIGARHGIRMSLGFYKLAEQKLRFGIWAQDFFLPDPILGT